jgi:hypothetical protein
MAFLMRRISSDLGGSISALLLALMLACSISNAQQTSFPNLLPSTTVAFLKVESLELLLDHPLTKRLRANPAFKSLMRSPEAIKVRGGLALFEFAVGDKLETLVRKLTAKGVCLAFDIETKGFVVVACAQDEEWLEEYLSKVIGLASNDAKSKKEPDPIRKASYRGIDGYEFQKMVITRIKSMLVVTNKPKLAKDIIDRMLDTTQDGLDSNPRFQQASSSVAKLVASEAGVSIASGFMDLETLRNAGFAKELLGSNRKDFAGELLLGGVLAALQKTNSGIGVVSLQTDGIRVRLSVPYENQWNEGVRSFFVGEQSRGFALDLPEASRTLAGVSVYRNLSELWLRAGDLFDERVNDQLAQADNTLTTLFSGKDFGADILGAIQPEVRLYAQEQDYDPEMVPSIKLPSFGLVAQLRDASMKKELKRTFQSFVGFINVAGAMEGRPQMDLDSELIDGVQYYSATFLRDKDRNYDDGLPIEFNLSPTLAFKDDLVFLASSSAFAKTLASLSEASGAQASSSQSNTLVSIDFNLVKKILETNRLQLISQNMLEKGHNKTEAESEIDVLLGILALFRSGKLSLRFDEFVRLQLDVAMQL